jgi:vacuolar-type H+-ATPase subunit H
MLKCFILLAAVFYVNCGLLSQLQTFIQPFEQQGAQAQQTLQNNIQKTQQSLQTAFQAAQANLQASFQQFGQQANQIAQNIIAAAQAEWPQAQTQMKQRIIARALGLLETQANTPFSSVWSQFTPVQQQALLSLQTQINNINATVFQNQPLSPTTVANALTTAQQIRLFIQPLTNLPAAVPITIDAAIWLLEQIAPTNAQISQ